ncbi:hypothetical protein [Formosa haliotis]|uniref:hypothetical protein n=1 Tax=Formosa haliotis TaxID=1555194 RepID=UPI001147801D|nr:hypothetical protein [Formosa haliotis]
MLRRNINVKTVRIGQVFTIGTPVVYGFSALHFPKSHAIIKRGGVPNYLSLVGVKVKVLEVNRTQNCTCEVVLQRCDGTKFFRVLTKIKANLNEAIAKKELY